MNLATRRWAYGIAVVAVLLVCLLAWYVHDVSVAVALGTGCAFTALIVVVGAQNVSPRDTRAEATERTLRVAAHTFRYLRGGLTPDNARAICALIIPETNASAIAITDRHQVLACEGSVGASYGTGAANSAPTEQVLSSKRMQTFISVDEDVQEPRTLLGGSRSKGQCFGIIVPLLVKDEAVGTIKLYYSRDLDIDRTQLAIAEGFGLLLSTQLLSHELDQQAELTTRAELKALQAQINPHFLFNALNTIASFTRTNPTRARDLLRDFSRFYRATLENSEQTLISLAQELEQTRRYLKIEQARFGEERIIETEHIHADCDVVKVPSFLIQPLVENAVRHAMRDEGALHIDIQAVRDGNDVLISIADDGVGMSAEVAQGLLEAAPLNAPLKRGCGMALKNVAHRLERFFGDGSGVEILSKEGEGTCITLRLADCLSDEEALLSSSSDLSHQ